MEIKEQIERLPNQTGVYMFLDKSGKHLYIGKAENIKKRVKSHIESPLSSPKEEMIRKKTSHIEYLATSSEVDALVLECDLIKKYRPRYNISLRDDKKYPYIKISLCEEFPSIYLTRDLTDKKARYFGPYTNAKATRKTLKLLRKILAFKNCRKKRIDKKACLEYFIGRCVGPCTGELKRDDYMEIVNEVTMFLEGKVDNLIAHIKERMKKASEKMNYELAGKLRDQIESIRKISSPQQISSLTGIAQDFIGYARGENKALITLLKVRDGKFYSHEHFPLINRVESTTEEGISSFLKEYYPLNSSLPDEIGLLFPIKDGKLFEKYFKKLKGKKVRIFVPKKGRNRRLLEMAEKNAEYRLTEEKDKETETSEEILTQLKTKLKLPMLPFRIEGIDISNIRGKHATGSVVVFERGEPKKDEWRRFKIKEVETIDDYRMMEEVVRRRYRRIVEEKKMLPDLLVVDGGEGHLNRTKKVLKSLGLENIPVIALAKGENKIYSSVSSQKIPLNSRLEAFHLLAEIRDEAHRFAHFHYENLRKKDTLKSIVEEIPYIGDKLKAEIIRHFGSWEEVRSVSKEELMKVKGVGKKRAQILADYITKKL